MLARNLEAFKDPSTAHITIFSKKNLLKLEHLYLKIDNFWKTE